MLWSNAMDEYSHCRGCARDFSSAAALKQHLKQSSYHQFSCYVCQKVFCRQAAVDQHCMAKHPNRYRKSMLQRPASQTAVYHATLNPSMPHKPTPSSLGSYELNADPASTSSTPSSPDSCPGATLPSSSGSQPAVNTQTDMQFKRTSSGREGLSLVAQDHGATDAKEFLNTVKPPSCPDGALQGAAFPAQTSIVQASQAGSIAIAYLFIIAYIGRLVLQRPSAYLTFDHLVDAFLFQYNNNFSRVPDLNTSNCSPPMSGSGNPKPSIRPEGDEFTTLSSAPIAAMNLVRAQMPVTLSPEQKVQPDPVKTADTPGFARTLGRTGSSLCWADCGKRFASVYDILTHLEGEMCASKITRVELHTMLVEQQNGQEVIYHALLQDMVQGLDLYVKYGRGVHPFICPTGCSTSFKTLADLVRMVTS